jgi:predicted component of type VI protein secretion system
MQTTKINKNTFKEFMKKLFTRIKYQEENHCKEKEI